MVFSREAYQFILAATKESESSLGLFLKAFHLFLLWK